MPEVSTKRILVVDDREEAVYSLAKTIRLCDPDLLVETAYTAEQALNTLRTAEFDLVLCDFKLPGITGLSFLKLAAQMKPNTPVVIFTGYHTDDLEKQVKDEGAYAYLRKPLESSALKNIIHRAFAPRSESKSGN